MFFHEHQSQAICLIEKYNKEIEEINEIEVIDALICDVRNVRYLPQVSNSTPAMFHFRFFFQKL